MFPPSTAPQTAEVLRDPDDQFLEYARTRDPRLRDELVDEYVNLAYSAARRFVGRGEDYDDLKQVALLGLVQAVERFEPSRGLKFSTFAMPTIVGTLKRHFRDRGWFVRPPRPVQERYLQVSAMIDALTNELQRSPTVADIVGRGKWSEAEVREALLAADHRHHHPWLTDGDDRSLEPAAVDTALANVEDRAAVEKLLEQLHDAERDIITMRFYDDLAQTAIAQRIGVSQMHVSRVLARTLHQLRTFAAAP